MRLCGYPGVLNPPSSYHHEFPWASTSYRPTVAEGSRTPPRQIWVHRRTVATLTGPAWLISLSAVALIC